MGSNKQLRIEVLLNSKGPHEKVRVTDPFNMLKAWGVDTRIHNAPFHLPTTIRTNSLVIWQRPLPETEEQQLNILRWIRDKECILLTEWDDHPSLFPGSVVSHLKKTNYAALRYCHLLHTSNITLLNMLKKINPYGIVLENATKNIPDLELKKHISSDSCRIFIGNQNRQAEHLGLVEKLRKWCEEDPKLKIIIIQDYNLKSALPNQQVEFHQTCNYEKFRTILRSCHIALLPLKKTRENWCKTPIKWIEASAESVACVGGPALYGAVFGNGRTGKLSDIDSMVDVAKNLWKEKNTRIKIVQASHKQIQMHHTLTLACSHRLWVYKHVWRMRTVLDKLLLKRHPEAKTQKRFRK